MEAAGSYRGAQAEIGPPGLIWWGMGTGVPRRAEPVGGGRELVKRRGMGAGEDWDVRRSLCGLGADVVKGADAERDVFVFANYCLVCLQDFTHKLLSVIS